MLVENVSLILAFLIHPILAFVDCGHFKINDDLLRLHNEKRKIHNTPALIWNDTLEKSSMSHAVTLAEQKTLYHAAKGVGENLYSWWGSKEILPKADVDPGAVRGWYDEVECYCGYETSFPPCVYGHFTQLVWKNSKEVGCATCVNKDSDNYYVAIVCRYYPPGNVCGMYKDNVLPPFGTPNNTLLNIINSYVAKANTYQSNAVLLVCATLIAIGVNLSLIHNVERF